jgi:predicted transposase YdaD
LHQYDATLKQLFERQARGLLRILTGSSEVQEFLNVELPQVNVPRLDLMVRMKRPRSLFNIEFQTTNETFLPERAGIYYLQTIIKNRGKHVGQVVLYLGKKRLKPRNAVETPVMHFKVRLVDIGELDGEALAASGDLGDVMLAILARVKDRQAAIRRALDQIATLEEKERELAIEQLVILTGLRGLEVKVVKEARKYMPFVVDLMDNVIFRERYERGVAEGRAEGLSEGEAKGRAEVLQTLLTKRFGKLPAWAQERLAGATKEQIESWTLDLLDAQTLEAALGRKQ